MASISALERVRTHAPWSAATWRDTAFVVSGVPLQLAVWVPFWAPYRFWWISAIVVLLLAHPLTRAHRERFWAMLGVEIPLLPRKAQYGPGWQGALRQLRSWTAWRVLLYHVLVGPLIAAGGLLTLWVWAAGVAMAALPTFAWALPDSSGLSPNSHAATVAVTWVGGVSLLLAAPWLAAGVTRLDTRAGVALLGPSRAEELARKVEDLAEKRASVVDAADLERRRIERDLHDGAQQRLVSLAMNLGLARETLTGIPDEAMQVIVEAHEEAKEALTELRNLIRGLHPAVLEDRGLDAALSGVAARVPLPVRLRVDVAERASSTVEAVAYFVVSEALTNVVKHAKATKVEITVDRIGDLLRVAVTDDGIGGAAPSSAAAGGGAGGAGGAGGTGLAGLARRVQSVDGTFRITSPAGGPTTITVELPCAL
ncbi:sensor histidine kinase [Actinomadura rudentiformis]|uniref:histidine kinase n=1 Tax=Actinomadura rudentiformis TaxID=359158 RepID=A0A6H9YVX2_9ACTN|nr:histidine kinase [Actinomadura rudentiformis]KAB2346453.1 sensor histidine kinase [Actinomadura rudentiformis]